MDINDYRKRKDLAIPEGYFEKLNQGIKDATCRSAVAIPKRRSLTRRLAYFTGYAAMVAIIATATTGILLNNGNGSIENSAIVVAEGVDDEYIDNMLTNYPIDEYTFYCYLTGCE